MRDEKMPLLSRRFIKSGVMIGAVVAATPSCVFGQEFAPSFVRLCYFKDSAPVALVIAPQCIFCT